VRIEHFNKEWIFYRTIVLTNEILTLKSTKYFSKNSMHYTWGLNFVLLYYHFSILPVRQAGFVVNE